MASQTANSTTVPIFDVDLDAPAAERWAHIVEAYRDKLKDVETTVNAAVNAEIGTMGAIGKWAASNVMAGITYSGAVYYGDELIAISKQLAIPLGQLVILQLVYEASAMCTSIILQTPEPSSTPVHIRSMDWEMDFLRDLTIEVRFIKGGRCVFKATTWAGYVGVLTGVRLNAFSVAVNFRVTGGTFWQNIKRALSSAWPVGFLVREVLTSARSYKTAVGNLALSDLIAPVYFTVCGKKHNEGVQITRDRDVEVPNSRKSIEEEGFVIQTNMDHFDDNPENSIFYSLRRIATGTRELRDLLKNTPAGDTSIPPSRLFELMSVHPIFNELTVYATYMRPSEGTLVTSLPDPTNGFVHMTDFVITEHITASPRFADVAFEAGDEDDGEVVGSSPADTGAGTGSS